MKSRLLKQSIFFLLFGIIFCNLNARKIVVYTIPKTGTHLLCKCITLLTDKKFIWRGNGVTGCILRKYLEELGDNQFLVIHRGYSVEDEAILNEYDTINFFLYRDPRDQIISYIFFTHKKIQMFDEVLHSVINHNLNFAHFLFPHKYANHDTWLKNIDEMYRYFLPWKLGPNFCSVCFENLVGPQGGGSRDLQIKEILKIAQHLDLVFDEQVLKDFADQLFGASLTFRKGQIGSWKEYFKEEHKQLFKEIAGQLLIDLAYEKDFDW